MNSRHPVKNPEQHIMLTCQNFHPAAVYMDSYALSVANLDDCAIKTVFLEKTFLPMAGGEYTDKKSNNNKMEAESTTNVSQVLHLCSYMK